MKSSWNYPLFFGCLLSSALLFFSWQHPVTGAFWAALDERVFHLCNSWVRSSSFWAYFWALCGKRWIDWGHDIVFGALFYSYIRRFPERRTARRNRIIFLLIAGACFIFTVKRLPHEQRFSPSMTHPEMPRLSTIVQTIAVKDGANNSFPSDHGITACLFAGASLILLRRKTALCACAYAAFMCMPRLVAGAHWMSDITVGSIGFALIGIALFFASPLYIYGPKMIERITNRSARHAKNNGTTLH